MRYITDLHNKYKDREIWVVGSDPTLEDYPDNFMDGKLCMTLHMAALKFPKAQYKFFNEYDRLRFLSEKDPKILKKKLVCTYPFFNRSKEETVALAGEGENTLYLLDAPYPPNGVPQDIFNEVGFNCMRDRVKEAKKGTRLEYGANGTCLHNGLYVAVMMGCNPINIIGCNHGAIGGKEHFGEVNDIDKGMRPQTASFSDPTRGPRMAKGTEAIIEGARLVGVTMNWFKTYEEAYKHTQL
jgi:hypothetical protein